MHGAGLNARNENLGVVAFGHEFMGGSSVVESEAGFFVQTEHHEIILSQSDASLQGGDSVNMGTTFCRCRDASPAACRAI